MIHKMLALYEHLPKELIDAHFNEYGLRLESVGNDVKVLALDFNNIDHKFEFQTLNVYDYDVQRNVSQFFLCNPKGNAVSAFPTIYVSDEGLLKTATSEIKKAKDINKLIRIMTDNVSKNPNLETLVSYLKDQAYELSEHIRNALSANSKTIHILTISIDGKFIGESPFFEPMREHVRNELYESYFTLKDKKIVGRNQVCSMCQQISKEVWGYVSTYNFYTAKTELAPIAGGFNRSKAHLNYPVCPECASKLSKLKPIVSKYFSKTFCGFKYLLIPEVFDTKDNDAFKEILEIFTEDASNDPDTTRIGTFTLGERKPLVDNLTKDVFDILAETKNYANYTMLFFKTSNSEFKILISVENIFPYQFKNVFEAKEKAESYAIFKQQTGFVRNEIVDIKFHFSLLKEFFPISSKTEGDFSKSFLELVRSTFLQQPISYGFLLHRLIKVIQKRFANESYFMQATRKAFLILKFYTHLKLINNNTITTQEVSMPSMYESFFSEHGEFFNSPAKRAVFLTGMLCQNLLSIQQVDRGSQPFYKKLNGLKLNPQLVTSIYPEIINKLKEYDKNYYTDLEHEISLNLVKSDFSSLSNNEISLIFALGMTLSKDFKPIKKDNTEEEK